MKLCGGFLRRRIKKRMSDIRFTFLFFYVLVNQKKCFAAADDKTRNKN